MIKEFFNEYKKIDLKIFNIMIKGFIISLLILLLACYVLALYSTYPFSHVALFTCLNLFKLSLTCFSAFFTCGIAINKIRQL